ncbi:serine/threonine-protein kinase SIK1 isoform X2 [Papio anubis]|nr:serine/threonine-protein kinase SIK1 isoform X2 [Papio anubis]
MVIMSEFSADPAGQGQGLQKPLRVGFYDIERTLGKGNFAVVKLARHRVTKTQVAIKIIDKTRLDSSNLEKIYREVQLMKLLNHPHIIKLYQVMETKDMLYIVTEFAKNGEMFDYLTSNGHLSENEARKKFWQILSAVEYCHDHHIVHRDLKTENLLLDGNMDIKLADFGFGNFYKSGEPLSTWCGSPPYAAPEVFEGKEYEGPQLDIWSLGVVLYVLVCGSLPFDGPNLPTLRQRVLEGRFRIPFFMSQDCESLIRRMLVVDPARRITIAQIRQHRWMRAEPCLPGAACSTFSAHSYSSNLGDYDEQALGIMQTLGVDRQRTVESLQNSSYNHFAAIYYLLLERLKEYRNAQCARPGPARQPRPRSSDLSGLEVRGRCLLPGPRLPPPSGTLPRQAPCPVRHPLGGRFLAWALGPRPCGEGGASCRGLDPAQRPLVPDSSRGRPVTPPPGSAAPAHGPEPSLASQCPCQLSRPPAGSSHSRQMPACLFSRWRWWSRSRSPDGLFLVCQLQVPQEGLSTDPFRPALLCPQPQTLVQSVLQAEMDCELQSSLQWPLFFPVDASCSGVFRPRPVSPSSLLDTAISEEARQGPGLEEEQDVQESLPSSTGRRHTLAEVSTRLSPLTAPCIVVSPSASASPAEGTSSDSCLTFSASKSPVGLSGTPATQGLLGACSPVRLASPFLGSQSATPVLPTQGGLGGAVLLPVSFQEGRRASDTSLTQGLKAFRQQLRKTTRTKGFLGLNKIKGLARQMCQAPTSRASRGGLSPFHAPAQSPGLHGIAAGSREGRSLLEEVLEQQR